MKYVTRKLDASTLVGQQLVCACCKTRLTYGYVLNTGEVIDGVCRGALRSLKGLDVVTEQMAFNRHVGQYQVEFFGLTYLPGTPTPPQHLAGKERSQLDKQAEKDEADLFG